VATLQGHAGGASKNIREELWHLHCDMVILP
jgi:hypothetical protein